MLVELIKLEKLKHLNLYALPYLKCDFFSELSLRKNSPLEYLDLCGNLQIVDDQLIQAAELLSNLNYLNLVYFI